jgi:hypothetical protein
VRFLVVVATALVVAGAAVALYTLLRDDAPGDEPLAGLDVPATVTPPPRPTPIPDSWPAGLAGATGGGQPVSIACRDVNGDLRIDEDDAAEFAGLAITLEGAPQATVSGGCGDYRRDEYRGPAPEAYEDCDDASAGSLLIWAVGSAGTDLLDPSAGESLGMLPILNDALARAAADGIPVRIVISASAIYGATPPQTSMERWVAHQIAAELDAVPCLRAVIIGHSHGGATVTSVAAAIEDEYADRLLGVLIDRTIALYDRPATEIPAQAVLLNFYQTNEGWHGDYIDAPNVVNSDESTERAPVALSDGGGGFAVVSHKTLDDAPGAQRRIVDGMFAWLDGRLEATAR